MWMLLILLLATSLPGATTLAENYLHKNILSSYNKDVRPEPAHDMPLEVQLDVRIKKIVKLEVRTQIFTVFSFMMLKWVDPQLAWNQSEPKANKVKNINMGSELIWTPDIVLYNTADDVSKAHNDYYKTKALIQHTGEVLWTAPVTWKVSCEFDITWFPVDKQICNLTFGSWTYHAHHMKLVKMAPTDGVTHDHFKVSSGEWDMKEMRIYEETIKFDCCPEPYAIVIYEFEMNRLSLYFFMYIILPLVSLAFLFLMVFFIPHDGERMSFGVTILLSITVYLLVISEELPEKSDDKSMLGICFIFEFYLLCAALASALYTTNLSRRKTDLSAFWLRIYKVLKLEHNSSYPIDLTPLETTKYLQNRTIRNRRYAEEMTDEEKEHFKVWKSIAEMLDKILFWVFLMLMILGPVFVMMLSLDKSRLGSD